MYKLPVLACMMMALVGCATAKPPGSYHFETERVVDQRFDETWTKIVNWFGINNINIKVLEKDSGIISAEGTLLPATAYDCGDGGMGYALMNAVGRFNVTARQEPAGTLVRVTNSVSAQRFTKNGYGQPVGAPTTISCASTGELETALLNSVR